MMKTFIILILGIGLEPAIANDVLPPLGHRRYFINSEHPSQPTEIRALKLEEGLKDQPSMRDPIMKSSAPELKFTQKESSEAKPLAQPKRVSRMSFNKTAVQGQYLVPRITFDRPAIKVGRQDEMAPADYRLKIQDSEQELRNFDW
jgi:hypothetical protein